MEVADVSVKRSDTFASWEATVGAHHVTNGDGGHFITVTGWGDTEERARRELASALRRVDFETEKSPER